jgi:glucose-like phosphotransferase system IIB component
MLLLIALAMAPAYFFMFTWAIRKFDVATPGRGGNVKLFTKKDYLEAKTKNNSVEAKQEKKTKATAIILAYGGLDNIKNVDACITKLRVQIKDATKVDKDKLKELGAMGVMYPSQQSVYAVFGTEADIIKNAMNELINESTQNPDLRQTLVK